jgi:uncharacterized membrane protein YkoI
MPKGRTKERTMKNYLMITAAALAALSVAAGGALAKPPAAADTSATSTSYTGHELAGAAQVSLAQARATALKARPGVITDQELEKEGGGSGLRYSFDIKSGGKTYEVGVDAKSGKVLENAAEGKNPD